MIRPGALRVAVVGAGIVGCAIALELRRRGAEVDLVDRDAPGSGCSFGNSGAISPSSVAPLAMPGVLASVPKMLLDADGPLHLPLAYLPQALPWLLRFVASARPAVVARSSGRLAELHANAVERHRAMTEALGVPELFLQRGHLHLYPDDGALDADAAGWALRREHGFRFERLDRAGIVALEPRVGERYRAAMFMPDQATIVDPLRYVQAMADSFVRGGGHLHRAEVGGLDPASGGWRLVGCAATASTRFDHVVAAAGAWSRRLLDPLGVHVALESQRGYHVQFAAARDTVSRTVVLTDRKVFVTPMAQGLRVGGTVEIGGLERPMSERRVEQLEQIARNNFPGLDAPATSRWMGHRPCLPDSVPRVGRADGEHGDRGLWLAVGHGHLGLTDSLNTALRIADAMLATTATVH